MNEVRLIDANELIKQMGWKLGLGDEENGANVDYMEALEDCKELIDNAPTVKTKTVADCVIAYGDGYETAKRLFERPQGEWIIADKVLNYYHECPFCYWRNEVTANLENFCPNCGASMVRGEKE